jgi:hypothetical protein
MTMTLVALLVAIIIVAVAVGAKASPPRTPAQHHRDLDLRRGRSDG